MIVGRMGRRKIVTMWVGGYAQRETQRGETIIGNPALGKETVGITGCIEI
jgi:hypothetical protein